MGVRLSTATFQAGSGGNPAAAAETVVALWTPIQPAQDGGEVILLWFTTLTIGTGGTSVQMRCRRGGTLTGVNLNAAGSISVTAGNTVLLTGMAVDRNAPQGLQQYGLTFQVNGATAASTLVDGILYAICP